MKVDTEYNDNELQFVFNESIVNKHFEEILDIISEKLKTSKQSRKNRNKIVEMLQETFPSITAEKLSDGFNMIYASMQEIPFKYDTIKDINESINRYSNFILQIHHTFKDHGYSMLLCGYFWLTRKYA